MSGELERRAAALDAIDLDQFEDFESDDLVLDEASDDAEAASRGRNAYIEGLWGRYGFDGAGEDGRDRERAILAAHKMVTGIVNTFSPDGEFWRVAFDPRISTAGTDMSARHVIVTPAPLFDENLTVGQAVAVMTGIGAHEISHPRYGRSTSQAVRKVFGRKRVPNILSNVLDDVRIERRFAADYPGYADVFRPMLDYVGEAGRKRSDEPPSMSDVANLAAQAIRYERWSTWTEETAVERDWWKAWAARWSREDAPRRHVEAVREGLKRIVFQQVRRKKKRDRDKAGKARIAPPSFWDERLGPAYSALPPNAKKAIRMSAEGRKGEDIAATLGISVDDARTLIRGARRKMAGAS